MYSRWRVVMSVLSTKCAMPIMPFIGVRISWLILAKKSDFKREPSSAITRALSNSVAWASNSLAWPLISTTKRSANRLRRNTSNTGDNNIGISFLIKHWRGVGTLIKASSMTPIATPSLCNGISNICRGATSIKPVLKRNTLPLESSSKSGVVLRAHCPTSPSLCA